MVKINLSNGTKSCDMEGKAVFAVVIDPVGYHENCATLIIGETSPNDAAAAVGAGIGTIINQLGKNTFDRAMLSAKTIDMIKNALDGDMSREGKLFEEKKIFEGPMEDYKA